MNELRSGDTVIRGSAKGIIIRPESHGRVRIRWQCPEEREEVVACGRLWKKLPNGSWLLRPWQR